MQIVIGSLVGLAFLFLLGTTFLYLNSRAERDIGRSVVSVAENVAEEGSKEDAQDKPNDMAKEGSSKENGKEKEEKKKKKKKKKKKEKKKNENRNPKPKASEIVPATAVTSTSHQGKASSAAVAAATSRVGKITTIPAPSNQNRMVYNADNHPSSSQHGFAFLPSNAPSQKQNALALGLNSAYADTSAQRGLQMTQMKMSTSGQVPQNGSAASSQQSDLFQSCQGQVNLWQYMTVDANSIQRGALLGRGAYAEVYKGRALGTDCAIKLYRSTASAKQLEEAMGEIRLGASLDHPCTLRILGWVRNPLQTITELCCGDLKAFYSNKIEELQYSEMVALRLLRVGVN